MAKHSSVILLTGLLCPLVWSQVRPPNLSPDNLPDTAFTCEDKVTGGYYADVEADCQLFHVCVQVSEYEFQDFHFLCPNDTVFDQQHLVCTNWFEVDCHAQLALVPLQFFSNDFGIKRGGTDRDSKEDEDVQSRAQPQQGSRLRNSGRGQLEVGRRRPGAGHQRRLGNRGRTPAPPPPPVQEQEGINHDESLSLLASITGSTPIPLGFTTTVRPPRAIENNGGFLSGRNLIRNHAEKEEIANSNNSNDDVGEEEEVDRLPGSFPKFGIDGRRPKVKANIRAKLANKGKKAFFQKFDKPTKKSGRKVNLDHKRKNRIEFVEPIVEEETDFEFSGPELRPDGRTPRVKSDIFAELSNTRTESELTTINPPPREEEPFFASPSSPAPFIFRGTPDPYSEQDLFGSASTIKPFFPTVSPPSLSPQSSLDESSRPSDRFQARPSPKRGRNRVVVETDLSSGPAQTTPSSTPAITEKSFKTRSRKNRVKAAFAAANALNDISDQAECNNPFDCPPKFLAAGRRPRVKSNLQARKRNFWHKQKVGTSGKVKLGRRKIRRGRKRTNFETEKPLVLVEEEKEEFTEQFVPTTRTTTSTTTTTTTQHVQEEENEIFDDFFDHQNDFFAASSTVSPVVFKGSPGPGFFSSPQPFFGNDGQQVSFTSPSPFGHGPAGGRPSFNNIGAHIDLGPTKPPKILAPENLLFISSTVSNKIVIGEEEITSPAPVSKPALIDLSSGRHFPSFPIRGDGSPSIKSKLDFSRRNKATFKFAKQTGEDEEEEEREENVTERNEFTSEDQPTTTSAPATTPAPSQPTSKKQFVVPKDPIKGKFPRVKSNLLFNRKNKERFRLKLAQLSARKQEPTTTTTTTSTSTTASDPTPRATPEPESETKGSLFKPRKKFNLRKKPSFFAKVPDVSITNSLLKFRNRSKFNLKAAKQEDEEIETTVVDGPELSTESILSVEPELEDDQDDDEQRETVNLGDDLDHVRKADRAPLNGNIRVEFKKKTAEDLLGNKGRFFINPDGRKPRVKSNIRAHLANRGQHFGAQHQLEPESAETFDGASSQLDLTPFNKEDDNNNKREVDNNQAPINLINTENEIADKTTSPPVKPLSFSLPLLPLQPVILNPRQANRNTKPPLPAAILKHINHITDIRSLPPLPPALGLNKRPINKLVKKDQTESNTRHGLEDRILAEDDEAMQISHSEPSNTHTALLDQIVVNSNENPPAAPGEPVAATPQIQIRDTSSVTGLGQSTWNRNKLSAFRALQQQVERREGVGEEQSLVPLV